MDINKSTRIQTSILNAAEKKALVWLAKRQPKCINSDHLTFIGFLGAVIIGAGYVLSNLDIRWLWLSCFGFLVNWYGDSLDGTLARVRNQQRPTYGYYLDHMMDAVNECIMFICVGLSSFIKFPIAIAALLLYLLLSMNVNMNNHLRGEFKLTYIKLGPTEFRIIVVLINILIIAVKPLRDFLWNINILGHDLALSFFDIAGIGIVILLFFVFFVSFFNDARYYSKIDPRKKN